MGAHSFIANSINSIVNQSDTSNAPSGVIQAIKAAAVKTGVNFSYLLQKASQESGFNATAQASTSSATGLYQFTSQTWLQMVKNNGAQYGLGAFASQITTDPNGRLSVSNPTTRQAILALRNDPQISAEMAGELDKQNAASLQSNVGGKIGGTELYLAHFLGAGGASDFISQMRSTPNVAAASVLPEAAAANPSVFYGKDGEPRSLQQIYQHFAQKFDGGTTAAATTQIASAAPVHAIPSAQPSVSSVSSSTAAVLASNVLSHLSSMPHSHSIYSMTADATPTASGLGDAASPGGINLNGSSTLFAAMILGQIHGVSSASSSEALSHSVNKKNDDLSALAAVA